LKKKEFKKKIVEEKNTILKEQTLLSLVMILFLPFPVLLNMGKVELQPKVLFIQWIIYMIGFLPLCVMILKNEANINKIYKMYCSGEDYKKSQKSTKKVVVVIALIIALISMVELSDFSYSNITGKRPILSVKDNMESNKYSEKYKSIIYDYYKCEDETVHIRAKNTEFDRTYAERIKIARYIDDFNKNLKANKIEKELDLYDYIYSDEQYIWIIEDGKLELRIELEEGRIEREELQEKGTVCRTNLICFDEEYYKNNFEKYAKIVLQTENRNYDQNDIDNLYLQADKGKHLELGIMYKVIRNEESGFISLYSGRILKDL